MDNNPIAIPNPKQYRNKNLIHFFEVVKKGNSTILRIVGAYKSMASVTNLIQVCPKNIPTQSNPIPVIIPLYTPKHPKHTGIL